MIKSPFIHQSKNFTFAGKILRTSFSPSFPHRSSLLSKFQKKFNFTSRSPSQKGSLLKKNT